MYLQRTRYLRFMSDIVCIYYDRTTKNVAKITVKKVRMMKTRTENYTKEHHKHKGEDTKIDTNTETKVTKIEVEGYQIVGENRKDP